MTHRTTDKPNGSAAYPLLPKWIESEAMNLVIYAAVPQHTFFRDPDGLLSFKGDPK